MNEATVEVEVPGRYAPKVQEQLVDFRTDAIRRLASIERGEDSGSAEDIEWEENTARLAVPLISQGVTQEGRETVTYQGDAHLLSNALDFRMGHLSEDLARVLGTAPVDYEEAKVMLEELVWFRGEAERVDAAYREGVA